MICDDLTTIELLELASNYINAIGVYTEYSQSKLDKMYCNLLKAITEMCLGS